jgi:hypothetical protein
MRWPGNLVAQPFLAVRLGFLFDAVFSRSKLLPQLLRAPSPMRRKRASELSGSAREFATHWTPVSGGRLHQVVCGAQQQPLERGTHSKGENGGDGKRRKAQQGDHGASLKNSLPTCVMRDGIADAKRKCL